MPPVEDPLDWTVDQVVNFLCHDPRTPWSQSVTRPPRPDPAAFEDALRTNMITGEVLLNDIDKQTLREDLGLRKAGHWSTILTAIRYLRHISHKYSHPRLQSPPFFERSTNVFPDQRRLPFIDVVDRSSAHTPAPPPVSPPREDKVEEPTFTSHIRPREHYAVDQQGRKRRKLDLNTTSQALVDRTVPATEDKQQVDKDWYIGPNKITPYELFYPILPVDDDEEDTFVVCSRNLPTAQRLFVKDRLHYFYRQQPIDLGSKNGNQQWAVVPYKHSNSEDKSERHFTLYSSKGGKVTVRQENIQSWPQLRELEANDSETPTNTLKASDPFSYLTHKYPAQEEDEDVYPLYGDSGSENGFDDETWLEIDDEKEQIAQGKQGRLSPDEVVSIIAERVNELEDKWRRERQPKGEQKARWLWLAARKRKSVNQQIKAILRDIPLLENRLRKLQNAIREGDYSSRSELQIQCQSMEQTVFNIQSQKWRMSILERPQCPPKVAVTPKEPLPAPKTGPEDEESLHSESGVESDGYIDSLFVDDLDTTNVGIEDEAPAAETSPEKTQTPQATESNPFQTQFLLSSDDDAILSPFGTRLEAKKRRAVMRQQKEQEPDSLVDIPTKGSLLQKDASPATPKSPPMPECIDLTMESPRPEADEDLRIETPPLNPSVPKAPNSTEAMVKSERRPSVSPQPSLGASVLVEVTNKKKDKRHDNNTKKPQIDFAEASRMPWDLLEEHRDRKRILAKLVSTLPDEEREHMLDKIPNFLAPIMRKYVTKALKSFANRRGDIHGVDEIDKRLARRTATVYSSWVNCRHYDQEGPPKRDIFKARSEPEASFNKFHDELGCCLIAFDEWLRKERARAGSGELMSDGDKQNPATPHRKRKRVVKESQEVKRNHETAQLRVAVQDEQRRVLEQRLESIGLSDSDPMHQAVSFGNPIIYLDPHIGRRIKPHQLSGIQFMWRELVEDEKRQGCVLAHTMGLGKTMQIISFLVTVSAAAASTDANVNQQVPSCFHRSQTLVLCPSSLIENWYEEFLMWSPKDSALGPLRKITSANTFADRLDELFTWDEEGGILIMSYDIFRTWILNRETKTRAKPLRDDEHNHIKQSLLEGPNIVVADEAHKMKNRTSGIATAASEFRTKSRIALTGSPLANNLGDYYSMVDWISPGYLGNSVEFKANYVEPIEEGLYADSSYNERRKSLMKLQVLKEILNPKVNRADISVLAGSLPPKVEFVITVPLTDLQKEAYNSYIESVFQGRGEVGNAQLWTWMAILSLCCNHPACFQDKLLNRANDADKPSAKADEFDNSTDLVPGDESVTQAGLPESVIAHQEKIFAAVPDIRALGLSCRAQILDRIVTESIKAGDKVLIFSHSLPTLDYVEHLLKASRHNYCRLDGQTPIFSRQAATKRFNSAGTEQVYLISTRAGGLGLNIPGASRVVIFDFSFSPVWEEQAIGRAYRLGQQKPVFVYRFLAGGTFEEVMYNKAIFKTQLAFRVVDKKNPIRWASRSLGDYLFPVKKVEQQNISEYIGKDPHVLDKIISDDRGRTIRKIALTETFQREDNDKLTEEEKQGVQQEIKDEQLKRTDPVAYENVMRERQLEEAKRLSATMSNFGGSYHYGYQPSHFHSQYTPPMPQSYQQIRTSIPTTAHTSGPPPMAPDTSVIQSTYSTLTPAPSVPYIPQGGHRTQDNTQQSQREPSAPVSTTPVSTSTASAAPAISSGPPPSNQTAEEKRVPAPAVDGPLDTNAPRESPVSSSRPENGFNVATHSVEPGPGRPDYLKSPCMQQ